MDSINYAPPVELERNNPDTPLYSIKDPVFAPYGRLFGETPVDELIALADCITGIDPAGNRYVAGVREFEDHAQVKQFAPCFGGIPIQAGYCNGPNQTMNGFEYHKTPEISIAVTDSVLFLCLPDYLENFTRCSSAAARAFYIPRGSVLELYPRILHLSPCAVYSEGFKMIIILPAGTNLPLNPEVKICTEKDNDPETRLLFKHNKWMIAHPERQQLTSQGVYPGLYGKNRRIIPIELFRNFSF